MGGFVVATGLLPVSWPNVSFTFRFIDERVQDVFSIDGDGVVSVSGVLDREIRGRYVFIIEVLVMRLLGVDVFLSVANFSGSEFRATSQVDVSVLDVNDNAPVFVESVLRTSLLVDAKMGEVVLRPTVVDVDVSFAYRNITFALLSTVDTFYIHEITGAVYLAHSLDPVITSYVFTVVASDGLHHSTVEAQVVVTSDPGECGGGPCVHGRCAPLPVGYACVCNVGYSGNNCGDLESCFASTCGDAVNVGRCLQGYALQGCLQPSNIDVTATYKNGLPYTSVSFPQLKVDGVAKPELCYSTLQLEPLVGNPFLASPLRASVNASFSDGRLRLVITEEQLTSVSLFLQICCPEFDCFTVGDLRYPPQVLSHSHYINQSFRLLDDVRVTIARCPFVHELDHGRYSCSGFGYGDSCEFECEFGFTLVGEATVECREDGKWAFPLPLCKTIDVVISSVSVVLGETFHTGHPQTVSVTAVLSIRPEKLVVLPVVVSDTSEVIVSVSTLMFTNRDWNVSQEIWLSSTGDDGMFDEDREVTVTVGPAIASDLYIGQPSPAPTITVTNVDIDWYLADFILYAIEAKTDTSFDDVSRVAGIGPKGRVPVSTVGSPSRIPGTSAGVTQPIFWFPPASFIAYANSDDWLIGNASFTVDFWLQLNAEDELRNRTVIRYGHSNSSTAADGFEIRMENRNLAVNEYVPVLCLRTECRMCHTQTNLFAGNFHHYSFIQRSDKIIYCFVDGNVGVWDSESVNEELGWHTTLSVKNNSNYVLHIGGFMYDGQTRNSLNAQIDLIRLFNRDIRHIDDNLLVTNSTSFMPPGVSNLFHCVPLLRPVNGAVSCAVGVEHFQCTYSCLAGHHLFGGDTVRVCYDNTTWSGSAPLCIVLQVVVSDLMLTVGESRITGYNTTASFAVRLTLKPSDVVVLPVRFVSTDSLNAVTLNVSEIFFSPDNWTVSHYCEVISTGTDFELDGNEEFTVVVGPAVASEHYVGYPMSPPTVEVISIDEDPYIARFILQSEKFISDTSFDDATIKPEGVEKHIAETVIDAERISGNATGLSDGTTTINMTDGIVVYPDHMDWRVGNGSFTLDLWAQCDNGLNRDEVPLVHYSYGLAGVPPSSGFSLSLIKTTEMLEIGFRLKVCLSGECDSCDYLAQGGDWHHYAVIRETNGDFICWVDGHPISWLLPAHNPSWNASSNYISGENGYKLYVGGNVSRSEATSTTSLPEVYLDLVRLYADDYGRQGSKLIKGVDNGIQPPGNEDLFDCGILARPANGSISCSRGQGNVGDECTLRCDFGYDMDGVTESARLCEANEYWNGTELVCTFVECGQPERVENGIVDCTGTTFNETCKQSCLPGHLFNGSDIRYCLASRLWDGQLAVCTPVECPQLVSECACLLICSYYLLAFLLFCLVCNISCTAVQHHT